MENSSQIELKRRLETMATTKENDYGPHLFKILKSRKEAAKRMLREQDDTVFEQLRAVIKYHNNLICEVLGMPKQD